MITKKTRNIRKKLLIITVVSILACAGIISYYNNISEKPNNSSICQTCSDVTQEEIDTGWYWGFIDQKKPGTADTWIHVSGDSLSAMWVDPNLISDIVCQTCSDITQEEINVGWYYGQLNQKKPGTPDMWLHKGEGTKSAKWFDPSLIDPSLIQYNKI